MELWHTFEVARRIAVIGVKIQPASYSVARVCIPPICSLNHAPTLRSASRFRESLSDRGGNWVSANATQTVDT